MGGGRGVEWQERGWGGGGRGAARGVCVAYRVETCITGKLDLTGAGGCRWTTSSTVTLAMFFSTSVLSKKGFWHMFG